VNDPAYIFFTSGTTGVPKGVLGSHKGLSHFLSWQRKNFAVGPQDRCAQLLGLSFDAVLRDVFLPLTSGATLCLPQEEDGFALNYIPLWLEREGISLLHTVPSLAQSWLDDLPPGITLHALRLVFFTGEPLTGTLVQRWRETFPQAGTIINLYGPTETTLVKCFYRVPADEVHPGVQPVGWALPETQALVIAGRKRLCGIGEVGEIVFRTPFRTLGYINAPEEQHKRFVPNPWREEATDLLYYTGDEGRYRPDGSLEILGRVDHQVKIRGVRIEPDEVTATLVQHPGVAAGIVVACQDRQGQMSLVAYVVERQPQGAPVAELRAFLGGRMPPEMVPTRFMRVERLPLTPNGKLDRRALPLPEPMRPELEQTFVAPRTPAEEVIAEAWRDVLGLEQVGVYDNFFALGGHSLKATQVLARLNKRVASEVSLRSMFQFQTIAALATFLVEQQEREFSHEVFDRLLSEIEAMSEEEAEKLLPVKA
jgi:amino acid adenylation domain-containing protein